MTPATATVVSGTSQQFTATGTYSDGSTANITSQVTWVATNGSGKANISNNNGTQGLATGTSPGTATITASLQGVTSNSATLTITGAALSSITVTPPGAAIAIGTTQQYTATGNFTDGSSHDISSTVTWSITNGSGTATITTGGLATGTKAGQVNVVATQSGVSGSTTLTITNAVLTGLAVTPASPSQPKGVTQQFTATGTFSDGTTQDLTSAVTWAAAPGTGAATISNSAGTNGQAVGTAVGTVSVTATITLAGVTKTSAADTFTVTAATLKSIIVQSTNGANTVPNGLMISYTATGVFSDGSQVPLTSTATGTAWSIVPGTGTATVTNNAASTQQVTGTGVGTVTVQAVNSSFPGGTVTGSTGLTVTGAVLQTITVLPNSDPSIAVGTTQPFTAQGNFSDGTSTDISSQVLWTTTSGFPAGSNPQGTATVSNSSGSWGLATGKSVGNVTITATLVSANKSGSAELTVTAATVTSVVVSPTDPVIANGTSQLFRAQAFFSDGTNQDVTSNVNTTWSFTPVTGSVAPGPVNPAPPSGEKATGATAGTVTITASFNPGSGAVAGSTTLTITNAVLTTITVTPTPVPQNNSIPIGVGLQWFATGTFSDNTTQDLTSSVTWKVNGFTGSATISNSPGFYGIMTGTSAGTVQVVATLGSVHSNDVNAGTPPNTATNNMTISNATLVGVSVGVYPSNLPTGGDNHTGPSIQGNGNNISINNANACGNGWINTVQLQALATYSNNQVIDVSDQAHWGSETPGGASVVDSPGTNGVGPSPNDNIGLVTGHTAGPDCFTANVVNIDAFFGGGIGVGPVNVFP